MIHPSLFLRRALLTLLTGMRARARGASAA